MRTPCGFANRLSAHLNEFGMKGNWLDIPDLRPLDRAAFFRRKPPASSLCFLEHRCQYSRVEIAHVERSFRPPNDCGHNSRKCLNASHGGDRVGMLSCDGTYLKRKLCGRGQ